jgi:pimeloyl-ACP methyl ester carboxylesterase
MHYPRATFAVLDRAGHALPHEQEKLVIALMSEWLDRVQEHRGSR